MIFITGFVFLVFMIQIPLKISCEDNYEYEKRFEIIFTSWPGEGYFFLDLFRLSEKVFEILIKFEA